MLIKPKLKINIKNYFYYYLNEMECLIIEARLGLKTFDFKG